ncbi:START domain-containing protein [Desulfatiferula olefinivorans]
MASNVFKIFFLGLIICCMLPSMIGAKEPVDASVPGFEPGLSDPDWKETDRCDGFVSFTRRIEGSELTAYKGVGIIDCPIELLFAVLTNVSEHNTWVTYCASARELVRSSDNHQSFQYYDFDVPWPLSNRDVVVHCTTRTNWAEGRIIIQGDAIKEPLVPVKKDHLRITDSSHTWILESVSPDSTRVTFLSRTLVSGPVPGLLNRLVSHVIPATSLRNLKKLSMDKFQASSERLLAKNCPRPADADVTAP